MKENENDGKQKKLFQLLRELASVQRENMRLSFGINAREGRDRVKGTVNNLKSGIEKRAKDLGRRAQTLAKDYLAGKEIKEYEARLAEVEATYEMGLKDIIDQRAQLEEQETEAQIRLSEKVNALLTVYSQELAQAEFEVVMADIKFKGTEDYEEQLKQPVERRNKAIELCELQKTKIDFERKSILEIQKKLGELQEKEEQYKADSQELLDDKETLEAILEKSRALVTKQNPFQKMMGILVNKFNNRGKNFISKVMGSVATGTRRLVTETIPTIGRRIARPVTDTIAQLTENCHTRKLELIDKLESKISSAKERNAELKRTAQGEQQTPDDDQQTPDDDQQTPDDDSYEFE